jgi:hypothetical protein
MTTETTTHEQGALEWSDNAPTYCEAVADLYRWSANYDEFVPFRKFLDLIGFDAYEIGVPVANWSRPSDGLGFLELSKVADALQEYIARPEDVERWITNLLGVEIESGL